MDACKLTETTVRTVVEMDLEEIGRITIDHLAARFGVDRTLLCKRFKREQGITLGLFIRKIKMVKCELYLCGHRDITVKQLSRISGFEDAEYFARIFKSHFGSLPSRYDPFDS